MKTGQIKLIDIMAHGINIQIDKEEVLCQCRHWETRKKKLLPCVIADKEIPENWKCEFCDASFSIRPVPPLERGKAATALLNQINQVQFWGVKIGDESEIHKETLSTLRKLIPEFIKIQKEIYEIVDRKNYSEEVKSNVAEDSK